MSIWDTPSPPDPERDCGPFPFMTDRVRFHTVPLDRVSGLTFLCQSFRIEAIHAHTGVSPTAKPTFDRMLSVSRPGLTWIYLPVSPADRVLEFGARLRSPHLFAHPRSGTFSHHLGWLVTSPTKLAPCLSVVQCPNPQSLLSSACVSQGTSGSAARPTRYSAPPATLSSAAKRKPPPTPTPQPRAVTP
jgi:hypothetical protein